jgi:hypothetical protein
MGGPAKTSPGRGANITNHEAEAHVVASTVLLWQITVPGDGSRFARIHSAGTHRATCDAGAGSWTVAKVKPEVTDAPAGPDFTVEWATSNADGAWRYAVQYRIGSGAWRGWFDRTSKRSARFNATDGVRYGFRVRTINPGEGETGWSPARSVVA